MSGSEGSIETDFLLSIPPDYFNVHTPESQEKIDSDDSDKNYESVYVLSDLFSAKISTNLNQSLNLSVNTNAGASKTSEQYNNNQSTNKLSASNYVRSSIDDCDTETCQRPNDSSPCKIPIERCTVSIPGSPSDTIKSYFRTSDVTVKNKYCDDLQNCAGKEDGSGDNSGKNSPNHFMNALNHNLVDHEMNIQTTDNNRKKELLKAIDEYLDEVNKDDKKNIPSIVNEKTEETNHIMNRFLKDDMERVNSIDVDGKSETGDSLKFDLQQVDSLLKEMENAQSEIEKKLKSRDRNVHAESDAYTKKLTWQSGDFIGSVPDLGFGIRELYASPDPCKTQSDKPKTPVIEQPCLRKTFAPLQDGITNDVLHSIDTKPVTVPEERSIFSVRRRLNLDDSKLREHKVVSDSKQLSASNCSDVEKKKNIGIKPSSPNKFRKTSTFGGLMNRDLLSPKLQTKQYSSPKAQSTDRVQEYITGQNKVIESRHLSGVNTELSVLHKSDKNHPNDNLNPNGLLSLSDLWIKDKVINTEDPSQLKQKLEEERCRRQHCEQLIHNLQYRVLEQQEKLAVAMHVDQEKDKAIKQIRDAWHQLTGHWTELEEQRHKLAQELQKERDESKKKEMEISKKVERWNTEIAQALDLAAGYKKKSETMSVEREALKQEMDKRIEEMREKLTSVEAENKKCVTEKIKLVEELEETRREAAEEKRLVQEAQKELKKTQECVSELKAELAMLQEQKQMVATKLMEERKRATMLEQQKATMQQVLMEAKQNEKTAVEEAQKYGERLEVARSELRVFYQSQLESVVKEKLKEFQDQLDSAEVTLKAELQMKEKQWSEKAINQCRMFAERHKEEITKMDEQFRSEMKALKSKLADSEQKRITAENLLKEETNRRTEIAERLHSVMEKQWKEALKIITNATSGETNKNDPSNNKISEHAKKRIDTFLDMARIVTSEGSSSSSVAFYEDDILPIRKVNADQANKKYTYKHINLRDLNSPRRSVVSSTCGTEDIPFGREGLTTCRPATIEQGNTKPADQEELKRYIQMLLERPPGNPVENTNGNKMYQESVENDDEETTDVQNLKWEALMAQGGQKKMNDNKAAHSRRRPWK